MQDNEKKPALRFKGFTDPWEQRKLGEIAKEVVRNDPASDAPIMMITAGNGFIEQSDRYAFNNAGESLKKYILLECGELAYNHGASKLRPYGSCFALTTVEKARIPFVYHCFSVEKSNPEFLSIELNGANVENQLRKIVSSGARMDGLLNIAYSEYTEVTVQLPKKEEQDWIAKFFKQLDTLITLHQRKYEKLVNIKKSMLDKMFPQNGASVPEIRFKSFTDPWEQRKLGDISEIKTGPFGSTLHADDYVSDGIPIITTEHFKTGSLPIDKCGLPQVSENDFSRLSAYILNAGDIVFSRVGSVDINALITPFQSTWLFSGRVLRVRPQNKNSSQFLHTLLETEDVKNDIRTRAVGQTMPSINTEILKTTPLRLPESTLEQEQLGKYFLNLDTLITLHQRKLEKLQNIKKSCLEKMFV